MTEATTNTNPDRPATDTGYQPVSGFAIAAVCVAFVLVLLVLGLGGYAFFKHKPLLNAWFLAVAVVGFLLSVVARIQIRRSEGTRSGMKLATIAWWVTILVGAGYTTYLYATKFVLDRQSEEFTMAWFSNLKNLSDPDPAVQEQNFYEAFWRTLEPNARSYIDPKNKEQMELDYATQLAGFRLVPDCENVSAIQERRDSS